MWSIAVVSVDAVSLKMKHVGTKKGLDATEAVLRIIAFFNASVPPERNKRRKARCRFILDWIFGGVNKFCARQLKHYTTSSLQTQWPKVAKNGRLLVKNRDSLQRTSLTPQTRCAAFKSGRCYF